MAAGIAAVSLDEETKVVITVPPFQYTTAPLAKFIPDTVKVKAPLPAVMLLGESCVMAGAVAAIVPFLEL